jgi:hypothetical protein
VAARGSGSEIAERIAHAVSRISLECWPRPAPVFSPAKKDAPGRLGQRRGKNSLVVLGGWLDRAPTAYTCSLTRSLHGDAALPVLRLAERPFALSTIPTD